MKRNFENTDLFSKKRLYANHVPKMIFSVEVQITLTSNKKDKQIIQQNTGATLFYRLTVVITPEFES